MGQVLAKLLLAGLVTVAFATHAAAQELEQDPIVIKGERGLPKTLYIAPWKQVGEPLEADPLQYLWEPEAQPLERDTFLKELELRQKGYSVDRPSPSGTSSPADPKPRDGE
jgi:hypothetical protein